jgi:ABC-type dipeptide/oligopeptide/nickel transport system ATPase component
MSFGIPNILLSSSAPASLLDIAISAYYSGRAEVRPVRDVRLTVSDGEIVGLAGESGSGKSTIALAIMGLSRYRGAVVEGVVSFRGKNLLEARERDLRRVRGREIALVLQSPLASLNPALRIGTQIAEAWKAHERGDGWKGRIQELFERMRLPQADEFLHKYPRQLSVGQAQRVLIAMALLHKPALLIADEPTSSLDAITQAEILALIRELCSDLRVAVLFISHDLPALASVCHRIAVLANGVIVENESPEVLFREPKHPYTQALVRAIPRTPESLRQLEAAVSGGISSDRTAYGVQRTGVPSR